GDSKLVGPRGRHTLTPRPSRHAEGRPSCRVTRGGKLVPARRVGCLSLRLAHRHRGKGEQEAHQEGNGLKQQAQEAQGVSFLLPLPTVRPSSCHRAVCVGCRENRRGKKLKKLKELNVPESELLAPARLPFWQPRRGSGC